MAPPLAAPPPRNPATKDRLPSQVFTRGTSGAVKVIKTSNSASDLNSGNNNSNNHRPRSRSQTRRADHQRSNNNNSPHGPPPSRPRSTSERRKHNERIKARTVRSADHDRHSVPHDSSSDQGSSAASGSHSHSSPSASKGRRTPNTSMDSSIHKLSPHVHPSIQKPGGSSSRSRDSSPSARSSDSQKQHIKTAKKVIDDLHRAQGHERRIAAITNACEIFDHADDPKHNIELQSGAAQVLSKVLAGTSDNDEIRMLCSALEMVSRGSPRQVGIAFDMAGVALIPLLLRLLLRCETGGFKHSNVSVLNISKIILYLSRCTDLRVSLCRQQGMLDALTRVSTAILNPECRMVRIRIISSLCNCEENKVLMYEHAGLLDSIMRMAHLELSEQARHYAGSALMDLSSATRNQNSMANDDQLLGTLVKMILVEKSAVTRELMITSLQNLAFSKENRRRLVVFKDGIVLGALRKSLSSDPDAKARRRAAGVLTNLACDETGEKMGDHKGLLDTLAIVSTNDESLDVQTRASLALTKVASSITIKMECHETLLDALIVASLSKAPNSISAVFRIKAREPENREIMARHPGVLDTLTDICISATAQAQDRDNALRSIMHLVNEKKNLKNMCNQAILDALVVGANYEDSDLESARDSAIRALERLATEFSNRAHMARHPALLITVAKAVEREAKAEDAGRESEHGYLAKPLLMSLLLAM